MSSYVIMRFLFQLEYVVNYIDKFSCVEPSLCFWYKAHLIVVDRPFDVFLDLVCVYFIEYFLLFLWFESEQFVHWKSRVLISSTINVLCLMCCLSFSNVSFNNVGSFAFEI